jgi:hypothetical protein
MRRCEGAGCQCERSGECPLVDTLVFKVVRARDGVVLASFDAYDAALTYAEIVVNVMRVHGECNVMACEAAEEGEDA